MSIAAEVCEEAEIVIVGAGPAGSVAAFTLASLGHEVLVVDKVRFPRDKPCGDGHLRSAVGFLEEIGLGHVLDCSHAIEAARLFVDWRVRETIPLPAGGQAGSHRPCCIRRSRLDGALLDAAQAAGARFLQGHVTEVVRQDGRVGGVEVGTGAARGLVSARHLIAADGATSRLRRLLAPQARTAGAHAYAVRQYVRSERGFGRSFDIFVPLPLYAPYYGYAWVFPVDRHQANVGLGYLTAQGLPRPPSLIWMLSAFFERLRDSYDCELGGLSADGPPKGFPLAVNFAPARCQVDNVVFVGDAAQTVDPLTGEGVDQAMRSGHAAALALHDALSRGGKPRDVGLTIGRSNPRLGQDAAMIARVAHDLLRRRTDWAREKGAFRGGNAPLFYMAKSMLAADIGYPSMMLTPVGDVASKVGLNSALESVDRAYVDLTRNRFVLCSEMLYREACGGIGPVAAMMVLAAQSACGSEWRDTAVDAGVSCELLRRYVSMLRHVVRGDGRATSANNSAALLIGDHALACASMTMMRSRVGEMRVFAEAIESISEALARISEHRTACNRRAADHLEYARLSEGAICSLAARSGAILAGADHRLVEALAMVGELLGVAVVICEEMMALSRDSAILGASAERLVKRIDRTLPMMLAIEERPELASRLTTLAEDSVCSELLWQLRRSGAWARAGAMCEEYARSASEVLTGRVEPQSALAVLCELPVQTASALTIGP